MHAFLATLNAEWAEQATSRQARRRLALWAESHPALAGCCDLLEVLRRRSERPAEAPAILAALAALAPTDEYAARALLHALMPGIVKAAKRAVPEDQWALEEMVSLAWERIRTYPTTRNGSVAANVLWDVHKRYRQHRDIEQPKSEPLRHNGDTMPSAEDIAVERVTVSTVIDACRQGAVSPDAYELIIRTRYAGVPLREIAHEKQVSAHTLAQRRVRAERILRELPVAS